MNTVAQDIRFGVRLLAKQRGFSVVAVLTIALGIGISVALFSVIDSALLHPLPYSHPEQLVTILVAEQDSAGRVSRYAPSLEDLRTWRSPSSVFAHVGMGRVHGFFRGPIVDVNEPKRLTVGSLSEDFLETYGIVPLLGRSVQIEDTRDNAPKVVLLGHAYWQEQFGGDRQVVGRTLRIDDDVATIVGVLPAGFYSTTAVWRPSLASQLSRRGSGTPVVGRLRPGISLQQAELALSALTPASRDGAARVELRSMYDDETDGYGASIAPLAWGVGFIVLIGCVNVAALLLARGATRDAELAVRASIGATRGRLVRQLLTEGLILAALGAFVGVLLAWLALDALVALIPLDMPENTPATINLAALGVAVGLSIVTAVLFGLVPALKLSRPAVNLNTRLVGSGRGAGSTLTKRSGQALVATEVALALVLVTVAGLLVRSFWRLTTTDRGFDPAPIVAMTVEPVERNASAQSEYYARLLDTVRRVPEVEAAGAIDALALKGGALFSFPKADTGVVLSGPERIILPGYFEALAVRPRVGRLPDDHDRTGSESTAVINEAASKQFDGSPLGHVLEFAGGKDRQPYRVRIIGVVPNIRMDDPRAPIKPEVYVVRGSAAPEWTWPDESLAVVLRVRDGRSIPSARVRQLASSIGPRVVIDDIQPEDAILDDFVARPRHRMVLLTLLGIFAACLTLVGITSITAYTVARRTREIGIRLAFGATSARVVMNVLGDAARAIAIGLPCGLLGAFYATRIVSKFLFRTTPHDVSTFATAVALLAICALLAAWLPARRAGRLNPVVALRAD